MGWKCWYQWEKISWPLNSDESDEFGSYIGDDDNDDDDDYDEKEDDEKEEEDDDDEKDEETTFPFLTITCFCLAGLLNWGGKSFDI